ncbi:hypothetical protein Tco_1047894 [Tanacetum coccineum]
MVAYLEKSEGSEGFHQIIDFLTTSHIKNAFTKCPTLYASPIEQFWQTAALSINEDEVRGITATIDRKVKRKESFEQLTLMGVKKLEQTIKTSQARRRAKVVITNDEEAEEDPSNQGRSLIEELDLDAGISLVPLHAVDQGKIYDTQISDQPEGELGVFSAATALADAGRRRQSVENVQTYSRRRREVSTGSARFQGDEHKARFKAEQEKEQERIDFETALELQKQYHTLQNRPFSVVEVRNNMYLYLKNQGGYKMSFFIGGMSEQAVKESSRTAGGRRKKSLARKRAKETFSEESAKKQKLKDDTEKEELQVYLNIVSEEESLNIESLATKQDVLELYRLVKEIFQTASLKGYDLLLWGDLKTMMEPNGEDEI